MTGKNPTIAALLGLVFGQLAYVYVWRIGRGILVFALNFMLFYLMFGSEPSYTPELLAASIAVNVMISFDCWRIAKLSNPAAAKMQAKTQKDWMEYDVQKDIYCQKCGINLAVPVKSCPQCGAETKLS